MKTLPLAILAFAVLKQVNLVPAWEPLYLLFLLCKMIFSPIFVLLTLTVHWSHMTPPHKGFLLSSNSKFSSRGILDSFICTVFLCNTCNSLHLFHIYLFYAPFEYTTIQESRKLLFCSLSCFQDLELYLAYIGAQKLLVDWMNKKILHILFQPDKIICILKWLLLLHTWFSSA